MVNHNFELRRLYQGAAGKWPEMNIVGKLLQDPINFPAGNYFYFLKIKNISRP